jgi:hypothetical protein
MTPKEKAKELYFKMHSQEQIVSKEAKQCALIAVDEIINEYPNAKPMIVYMTNPRVRYWEDVKKEIEAL